MDRETSTGDAPGEGMYAALAELLAASGEQILFGVDCQRGVFLYASPRLAQLHGVTQARLEEDGLKLVLDERLDQETARRLRRHVLRLCRKQPQSSFAASFEYPLRQPDGNDLWFSCSVQLVSDAGGRPLRLSGLAVDVTARLHADIAVR